MPTDDKYHPLFEPEPGTSSDDFRPEPIASIHVYRNETGGRFSVPRRFLPDELPDWDAVYERWGGGTYEVVARNAKGEIYAKRVRVFPGPSKALVSAADAASNPAPTSSQPGTSAPPLGMPLPMGMAGDPLAMLAATGRIDPMVVILMMMMDRNEKRSNDMIVALLGRPQPPPPPQPPQSSPSEMMTALAAFAGAMKPAPPPPATPLGEVLTLQKLIREEATAQHTAAASIADARAPEKPEPDLGTQIATAAAAVGPLLQMLPAVLPATATPSPLAGPPAIKVIPP